MTAFLFSWRETAKLKKLVVIELDTFPLKLSNLLICQLLTVLPVIDSS